MHTLHKTHARSRVQHNAQIQKKNKKNNGTHTHTRNVNEMKRAMRQGLDGGGGAVKHRVRKGGEGGEGEGGKKECCCKQNGIILGTRELTGRQRT